jgi:starvation-inducible DNA-binding protein
MNVTLANAIVTYQKLHHFHWRVSGDRFFELHARFESLYDRFSEILDNVAERMLMIGGTPIKTLAEAVATATLVEDAEIPAAREMAARIMADLKAQREQMLAVIAAAEQAGDRGTVNLLDGIADSLDKEIWLLRSYLAD